jgi:hypothetical protein
MILFTLAPVLWREERDKDATPGKNATVLGKPPFAMAAKVCTSETTPIRLGRVSPAGEATRFWDKI